MMLMFYILYGIPCFIFFGLYDSNHHMVLNRDKTTFILSTENTHTISVHLLKDKFERGIEKFKDELNSGDTNFQNFNNMFGNYGSIKIE